MCGRSISSRKPRAVRGALQADIGIRDVKAARILLCIEFARNVDGVHGGDLSGSRLRESDVAAVFASADECMCVG